MGIFDEKCLIQRVINNDREAFNLLYVHYLNNLYRYIYVFTKSKELTEEIIQNVFVKIWDRRASLENVTCFKAYLYRSAKNLLVDEIRRSQVQSKAEMALKPETEAYHEESDTHLIYKQYYQIAQDAINLLPEKRRQIVQMRIMDDLTLDEIAERLCISKNVVKKQLYAGLQFLRAYLQKNADYSNLIAPLIMLLGNL